MHSARLNVLIIRARSTSANRRICGRPRVRRQTPGDRAKLRAIRRAGEGGVEMAEAFVACGRAAVAGVPDGVRSIVQRCRPSLVVSSTPLRAILRLIGRERSQLRCPAELQAVSAQSFSACGRWATSGA